MTKNTTQNWFQLVGAAIKQHATIIKLHRQIVKTQSEILPLIEENGIHDIDKYIKAFKEKPSSCGISFYDADYGIPIFVSEEQQNVFCPFYDPYIPCDKNECALYQSNKKFFELKKKYLETKQIRQKTIRQIFGLRTK